MKKIAFILASGNQQRWEGNNHKQLADIGGMPLLHRTIGQLRKRGIPNIVVTHHKKIIESLMSIGAVSLHLAKNDRKWVCHEIKVCAKMFDVDYILFLHGDVVWTDQAMDRITEPHEVLKVIGKFDELFGVSCCKAKLPKLISACEFAIREAEEDPTPPAAKLWQLLWTIAYDYGEAFMEGEKEQVFKRRCIDEIHQDAWKIVDSMKHGCFQLIEDGTDDIDYLAKWKEVRARFEGTEYVPEPGRFSIWED